MMKINPYTGEPMPDNFYLPTKPKGIVKVEEKLKPIKLDGLKELAGANTTEDVVAAAGENPSIGDKTLGAAGDILNFAANQYQNFNEVAPNTAESQKQLINSGIQGASLGMKIGGPLGAGIGAVAGAGLGLLDLNKDKNERADRMDREYRDERDAIKADRKDAYNQSMGEQESNALNNVYSRQQKFTNPYG